MMGGIGGGHLGDKKEHLTQLPPSSVPYQDVLGGGEVRDLSIDGLLIACFIGWLVGGWLVRCFVHLAFKSNSKDISSEDD
ncbi:unnamed protein product [Onchocerca flexuosa]|uniref:Uncharacterized protein n=1 Tax=Onchocerca flexuosa TaxID=387005 RepID=A0A183HMJ1_9BILA|nr:unnamed protein product [Onchocerca flexuosa]